MTLISELIDVPRQVQDGDFVLKLTRGTDVDTQATVDNYVVTDQIVTSFDEALGLIASAVTTGESKAAYLQGSFGSGKSHFMAMLHLILNGNPAARSKPKLHAPINKWGDQLNGKKFLTIPVHFLDSTSMEQTILGGYAQRMAELHPDAAPPAVFIADEILIQELPTLRARMGDDAFFATLNNQAGADDDAWGDFAGEWTAESVERAMAGGGQPRDELAAAYIAAFRSATVVETASTGQGFVDLDRGLKAISRHAAGLGYNGVVLFLDELILWLASKIATLEFVQNESQKLTKLVEGTHAERPVPIVSFVARQRDLRELIGNDVAGNHLRSLGDNLEYQSGRFSKIELRSDNLPIVARERILKPVDDAASQTLAGAVDQALGGRDEVRRQLLGDDADIDLFRTVYPFSPALVQTLIDVSEALQRERTALKVMLQLLVDQRDTLEVGEIIPVGDLWDVVVRRDEPFSAELKDLFELAKKLWRTKLEPALRSANNVTDATGDEAPERRAYESDARLVKTLLLAALVPGVKAFNGLDAARLVALNWGSVTAPIKGQETQIAANKLRNLAAQISELVVSGDPVNPSVHIRLTSVDIDAIINRAAETFDNPGARRTRMRLLIASALDDRVGNDLRGTLTHDWRGTRRDIDVIFGNIRDRDELADNVFATNDERPKLIIDFPFDQMGRTPEDDLDRLDQWVAEGRQANTVCWLPSFLNERGSEALGRYVAVHELLQGDRLAQYTERLTANQRADARPLLESQRSQLEAQLRDAVLVAYGVRSGEHVLVDTATGLAEHFRSLSPALSVRPTTKPALNAALDELCDQIFAGLYPGHPRFDNRITTGQLATAWAEIQRALADTEGRIVVEQTNRKALRNVANSLKLGTMHESHFVISRDWANLLDRQLNQAGGNADIATMRTWIDEAPGGPRGLPPDVADLVIMTVAAQTDHRATHWGAGADYQPGKPLPGDALLEPEKLPDEATWTTAVDRAAVIFGETFHPRPTGPELRSLGDRLRRRAADARPASQDLLGRLQTTYDAWGLDTGDRLATALAASQLLAQLDRADDHAVVAALADFEAPSSDAAVAKSISSAANVAASLGQANIGLWRAARAAVDSSVQEALRSDEIVLGFAAQKAAIEATATTHVAAFAPAPQAAEPVMASSPTPAVIGAPGSAPSSTVVVASGADVDELAATLRDHVEAGKRVEVRWQVADD